MTAPTIEPRQTDRPRGTDVALRVDSLWKIFGAGSDKIIGTADADLSRKDLQQKTVIRGGINNRGRSAVNAVGTPQGRYKKLLEDAIGSRMISAGRDCASRWARCQSRIGLSKNFQESAQTPNVATRTIGPASHFGIGPKNFSAMSGIQLWTR